MYLQCFPPWFADATPLTFFNTTSTNSKAYPVYVQVGLLPADMILSPSNLTVLALLPSYSEAAHPQCTKEQHAINRHILLWKALELVLTELTDLDATESTVESFLPLGEVRLGSGEARRAFAVPLLWLSGACLLRAWRVVFWPGLL